MSPKKTFCQLGWVILLILSLLLVACGGGDPGPAEPDQIVDSQNPSAAEAPDALQDPGADNQGVDISGMVNQELPPGFPSNFPIPPNAQVSSTVSLGADDEYRVYFAVIDTLEQTIAFFDGELPLAEWTIVEQKETSSGYEFEIENPTYTGSILLVGAETGVALDVHLIPAGSPEMPLEIAEILGDVTTLGDTGSGLPSDLPIPTSFAAVDIPAALLEQGYGASFQFDGLPEMALVDFNLAMFSSGWMVEGVDEGDLTASFVVLFRNPSASFQGYALVTDNLAQLGASGITGTLIALHEGTP